MTADNTKIYKTTVTLINWTEAEIAALDEINVNWMMTGQVLKRGNTD